jgi:hypothetical protein
MKKYYYKLDEFDRFVMLKDKKIESDCLEIELENIDNIEVGWHGIKDGKVVFIGKVESEEINRTQEDIRNEKLLKISGLIQQLTATDYQIIKCYEAFMRQQTLPYNLEELSAQRDEWRAEINQLEEELKNL